MMYIASESVNSHMRNSKILMKQRNYSNKKLSSFIDSDRYSKTSRHIKSTKSSAYIDRPNLIGAYKTVINNSKLENNESFFKPPIDNSELIEKEKEINDLKRILNEKDGALKMIKKVHMLAPINVSQLLLDSQIETQNLPDLINMYSNLFMKLKETFKNMNIRLNHVLSLADTLENCTNNGIHEKDLFKIKEIMSELSDTLTKVSSTEIDLNHLYREIDRKSIENSKLKVQIDKIKSRNETLESKLRDLEKKHLHLVEENSFMLKSLQSENTKQQESNKKVSTLQNRLEAIVQKNHNQLAINNSIKELMKENENLKWIIVSKTAENEKLQDINNKFKSKVFQLTKKLDSFKLRKISKKQENDQYLFKENNSENLTLLTNPVNLPISMDYRINNLKTEYSNMLNDIMLYGSSAFAAQITSSENQHPKKNAIEFVTSQFLTIREFSEKNNLLINDLINLIGCESIQDLMVTMSKNIKTIFLADEVLLWLNDSMTGIMQTYDSRGIEYKAVKDSGIFREVMILGKTINRLKMRQVSVYQNANTGEMKHFDYFILIPIIDGQKTIGLIQINRENESEINTDEEYLLLMLIVFSKALLKQNSYINDLRQEQKFQEMFNLFFLEICSCSSKYEFSLKINEWSKKIFSISTTKFLYIENTNLVEYQTLKDINQYNINEGICGYIITSKRAMIFTDVQRSQYYHPKIDIYSLLPVYYLPIKLNTNSETIEILGILQIVLKGRVNSNSDQGSITLNSQTSILADKFGKLVEMAYKIVFKEKN